MDVCKKICVILLSITTAFSVWGCQKSVSETEKITSKKIGHVTPTTFATDSLGFRKYTLDKSDIGLYIEKVINSDEYVSTPKLSDIKFTEYPEEEFLFNNHCFVINRDMDCFLISNICNNNLNAYLRNYPPQAVRTIDNNGQKSMYFVYETDGGTRVYVFFFESDNYYCSRGYPIIVKKSLSMSDFSNLTVKDTMKDVEEIDPITPLFRRCYDELNDEQIESLYIKGRERISTVHLLKDGIIRINYDRDSSGEYIINQIIRSDDFIISGIYGGIFGGPCYRIYADDYIE